MNETPHAKDFEPHLATPFRVEQPISLELLLAGVQDQSNSSLEQFSLFFAGPQAPWLQQGTYILHHAALGESELFLVPLGPKDGRMQYQSAFSRPRAR